MASVLYARETPPVGGDTPFANMHLALNPLSPGMRAVLSPPRAVRCAAPSYDRAQMYTANAASAGMKYTDRTHPEAGRKALYVNSSYTRRFEDMTEEESLPLLLEHITRPELTCRFRWTPEHSRCGTTATCSTTRSAATGDTGAKCVTSRWPAIGRTDRESASSPRLPPTGSRGPPNAGGRSRGLDRASFRTGRQRKLGTVSGTIDETPLRRVCATLPTSLRAEAES